MLRNVSTLSQLISFKTSTATFSNEAAEGLNSSFTGEAEAAEALYKITGFASRFDRNQQQNQSSQASLSVRRLSRSRSLFPSRSPSEHNSPIPLQTRSEHNSPIPLSSSSPIHSRNPSPHPSPSLQHRFSPIGSAAASSTSPLPNSSFGFTVDIDALEKEFPKDPFEGKNLTPGPPPHSSLRIYSGCIDMPQFASYSGYYTVIRGGKKPHGFGKLALANGDVYTGQFEAGYYHGCGTIEYSDGSVFKGSFLLGKKHGYGVTTYPDGENFRGRYFFGRREHRGCHSWPAGRLYIGDYKRDVRHGWGQYVFDNGNIKYEGNWTDDEPNGQGTIWYRDGRVYEGGVKRGKPHGFGRLTDHSGEVQVVWHVDGVRVEKTDEFSEWTNGEDPGPCTICFSHYKLGEWLKRLPCSHLYHMDCIIPWVALHFSCPICRGPAS